MEEGSEVVENSPSVIPTAPAKPTPVAPVVSETAKGGGLVVELAAEVINTEPEVGTVKPRDKRSGLVDRRRAIRQVTCYVCCGEFGTTSLQIHLKTCLKKHIWGLDLVEHEEGVPKKQAAINRKKCIEPSVVPETPVPTAKSKMQDFDKYNAEVLKIFNAHSEQCLWCRERNLEAIENARLAQLEADAKKNADRDAALEAARRAAEEEEQHRRDEEDALRRAMEEEEAHRRAEEEEEAHRLAEEEARRKHLERLSALAEARRRAAEAAAKDAAERARLEEEEANMMRLLQEEEDARRAAAEEEARRRKRIATGQHKFLKKGDGVIAASQAALVYQDTLMEKKVKEGTVKGKFTKHKVGGETFHDSHTSSVEFVEVAMTEEEEAAALEAGHDIGSSEYATAAAVAAAGAGSGSVDVVTEEGGEGEGEGDGDGIEGGDEGGVGGDE